jgi:AmiR/NasT family two-component response regulator
MRSRALARSAARSTMDAPPGSWGRLERPGEWGRVGRVYRSFGESGNMNNNGLGSLGVDPAHPDPLRVLLANEREDHMMLVASILESLGHSVIATSTDVIGVGALTARSHPDVALVGLGESSQHALELIERIVREASCPVIALLLSKDRSFVDQAARRGVFAYVVDGDAEQLQGALDVTLSRFREYHGLQGAFGRRAIIERAKGIVMERHRVDEQAAFALLRVQSRSSGRKLIDIATAVVDGHALLPGDPGASPETSRS